MRRRTVEKMAEKVGLSLDAATDTEKIENIEPYPIRWILRESGHSRATATYATLDEAYDDLSGRILASEIE